MSISQLRFRFGWILETKGTTEFHSSSANYFVVFEVELIFFDPLDKFFLEFHDQYVFLTHSPSNIKIYDDFDKKIWRICH